MRRIEVESNGFDVKAMAARLRALQGAAPKGLPASSPNETTTETICPTDANLPRDIGYDPRGMITGSGNGPEM